MPEAAQTSATASVNRPSESSPRVLALFGPTSVGKTGVAIEMARILRRRGEDPVAVNCDSIQIYRGLEVISGAADRAQQEQLEHRLVGFVDPDREMSAGRFAAIAHAEIDDLVESGRLPIVVGGTGLWLRAALSDLDLLPPVDGSVREEVERDLENRGSEALHAELPVRLSGRVHPNDRNRIARWTALIQCGLEPETDSSGMWQADLRHPTRLVGLIDDRDAIGRRIDQRVDAMYPSATEEARSLLESGPSRTARAAIGVDGFISGDLSSVKAEHRAYAKRQITWMKKMSGVEIINREGAADAEVAARILDER